jgi:hypothetical protein
MSATTGETSLNLEKDIERAIVVLDRLRTTSEIPETKLTELQQILQSDFFHAVLEVYEKIYETVQITDSPEVRTNATAKATVSVREHISNICLFFSFLFFPLLLIYVYWSTLDMCELDCSPSVTSKNDPLFTSEKHYIYDRKERQQGKI